MKDSWYDTLTDRDVEAQNYIHLKVPFNRASVFPALAAVLLLFSFISFMFLFTNVHTHPASESLRAAVTSNPIIVKKPKRRITSFKDYYFTPDEGKFLNCPALVGRNFNATAQYLNHGRLKLDQERLLDLPMDCDSIRERVYGDMPPFTPLKRPIAFVRTIYMLYEFQEALLSIAYHPDNTFCYTMDSKSTQKLRDSMRALSKCFSNVFLMEKEYNMDSGGHGQDAAHIDCLERILDRKWDHVVTLQNFDMIIKTPYQISDISEMLNYTSIMGFDSAYVYRYNVAADWTPAGIGLFRNETGVPPEILHSKLKVRKSLNEVMLSKVFVRSIFEKLNVRNIVKVFDQNSYYGVDEMLIATLFENYLGLEGQMESTCNKSVYDILTRMTYWKFRGPNGWDTKCKSNWKRHGICILGVEYLGDLARSPAIIANKVMSSFDFGTILCIRDMVKWKVTAMILPAHRLDVFPQFREMQMKADGTYNKETFEC